MTAELRSLVEDYLAHVREAVALLNASGIPTPESSRALALSGVPGTGTLADGSKCRKHGYGCEVVVRGRLVDFDFGQRGEIHGIDLWRLIEFAKDDASLYGFSSAAELKEAFESSTASGEIVRAGTLSYVA
jgi:hypothetical protein